MSPSGNKKTEEKENPMKTSRKEKISWADRIDLSENILQIVIVSIVMAILAYLATKLL